VHHAQEQSLSQRRACRLVNQPRGTQRYQATQREGEDALTRAVVELASQYGRYGYRRIAALLNREAGRSARTAWSASGDARG
jgi:putative transposase